CGCIWRAASASSAEIVPKILQRGAHTPVIAEGRADPACRPARRSDVGCANFGRTAPPIYPSVSFRQGQVSKRSCWDVRFDLEQTLKQKQPRSCYRRHPPIDIDTLPQHARGTTRAKRPSCIASSSQALQFATALSTAARSRISSHSTQL